MNLGWVKRGKAAPRLCRLANQLVGNHGQGGNRGRLGTQDQRPECDGLKAVLQSEGFLLRCEIALRSDEDENGLRLCQRQLMKTT